MTIDYDDSIIEVIEMNLLHYDDGSREVIRLY